MYNAPSLNIHRPLAKASKDMHSSQVHPNCDHYAGLHTRYVITSGQSNSTKRSHIRRTATVRSCSPGGANVHFHLTRASLDQLESTSQTASLSVQPFLHSSRHKVPILYNLPPPFPPQNCPFEWRIWTPLKATLYHALCLSDACVAVC